jgi:hypothetical protein
MKKTMPLIFLVIFSFISMKVSGQIFAPPGAVWHYKFDTNPPFRIGYEEIKAVGDTMLQGHQCTILERRNAGYDWFTHSVYDYISGREYVYSDSDKVYLWKYNSFYILYDFGASPGTRWTLAFDNIYTTDSLAVIVVDSVGVETIGSEPLRTLYVHTDSGYYSFMSYIIREKLGGLYHMFPYFTGLTGPEYPGPMRCYYDNNFGLYQLSMDPCDTIYTGMNNQFSNEENSLVYPNPVVSNSVLRWNCTDGAEYTIEFFDDAGKKVKVLKVISYEIEICQSDFKSGCYFFKIMSGSNLSGRGQFEVIK